MIRGTRAVTHLCKDDGLPLTSPREGWVVEAKQRRPPLPLHFGESGGSAYTQNRTWNSSHNSTRLDVHYHLLWATSYYRLPPTTAYLLLPPTSYCHLPPTATYLLPPTSYYLLPPTTTYRLLPTTCCYHLPPTTVHLRSPRCLQLAHRKEGGDVAPPPP